MIGKIKKALNRDIELAIPYLILLLYYYICIFVIVSIILFCISNKIFLIFIGFNVVIILYLLFDSSLYFAIYKVIIRQLYYSLMMKKRGSYIGYEEIIKNKNVSIRKRKDYGKNILFAEQNMLLLSNYKKTILYIIQDYRYPFIRFKIKLNKRNFEDLIVNSHIESAFILPYTREYNDVFSKRSKRICIITDQTQIYHNCPDRDIDCAGDMHWDDIIHFQESVIWDLPGRKYPSKNPEDIYERLYLGLPDDSYMYYPKINNKKINKYGSRYFKKFIEVNNKYGQKEKLSRFYLYTHSPDTNPFSFMGGFEYNHKMALIGTYLSNTEKGARICLFMSSDGGRQWFCKYEFGDLGVYSFRQGNISKWGHNWGNTISTEWFDGKYNKDIVIQNRIVIVPSDSDCNPAQKFIWGNKIYINNIITINGCLALECMMDHELDNGNIIRILYIKDNCNHVNSYNWMISGNNLSDMLLFKVEIVSRKIIRLHEFVSNPFTNIACRHIHHINKVKDGWILGTGEIYPNSWILYIQSKITEKAEKVSAADNISIYRLNSSNKSVQRTMGIIWKESEDKILYASDHDTLPKRAIKLPLACRDKDISRNSTGIYLGNIYDIDNRELFQCILDTNEVTYFFKEILGHLIVCGQLGEVFIQDNINWINFQLPHPFVKYLGHNSEYIVVDDYIILLK